MRDKKVTVIDYGIGNLLSVCRAFERLGAQVELTDDWATIKNSSRVILPGVGAFGGCIKELQNRKLDDLVNEFIMLDRPLLGICVGMQMLLSESSEFGTHQGLNVIPGQVSKIPNIIDEDKTRPVPHIGWSDLIFSNGGNRRLFKEISKGAAVYFVHSYYAMPEDRTNISTYVSYEGFDVVASIEKGNVFGVQFHPEKSGQVGLQVLDNFLSL